jgi:hypothetical protein
MSARSRTLLMSALLIALFLAADALDAQAQGIRVPRREGMPVARTPVSATGTVQQVMPPNPRNPWHIMVETNTNQTWYFQVSKETKVHVTGEAKPEVLSPGMFVQFTASVNQRGAIEGKVNDLLIFTPSPERMPGAFPAGMGGAASGGEGPGGFGPGRAPGINPGAVPQAVPGVGPGFGPGAGPGAGAAAETALLDLGGRISRIRGNTLTVYVPNLSPKLEVELTEQPTVRVDVPDYLCAQQGDKIEVRGIIVQQGLDQQGKPMGLARAREVAIELSQPLGPPEKKTPRRPTRPTRPSRTHPKPDAKEPGAKEPEPQTEEPGTFRRPIEPEK